MEFGLLFHAHCLIMVYTCTKFHELHSRWYLNYRVDTIFIANISKGHHSVDNVDGVTVLVLCTSSDVDLYFYKVS